MMKGVHFLAIVALLSLASSFVSAFDPSPLQDICVAIDDPKSAVFVNGKFCKDLKDTKADDFYFSGLQIPGNTDNRVGSNVTTVNVDQIPGLNTLGISLVRIDYAPYGQNPPHTHPHRPLEFQCALTCCQKFLCPYSCAVAGHYAPPQSAVFRKGTSDSRSEATDQQDYVKHAP
ncbi:germin-like protein subfamily 1 member 13 [Corylus avellana]|uniref:germin-like protein subfamily 1 member 13 n=1 Tax=Corylus avellana TaxID=13451 RepID=UPI00286ADCDF|nr:germin-like protein subfamily 1 member 13 [Corylus avellana]